MAAVLQHSEQTRLGHYQRWALDAGDEIILDFRKSGVDFGALQSYVEDPSRWSWLVTPGAGATVSMAIAFASDYNDQSGPWAAHGSYPTGVSVETGLEQEARTHGFRFSASGGACVVEFITPFPTTVN